MSLKSGIRKDRRRRRKKQNRINSQLKKRLFGHLVFSPCCYCKVGFFVEQLTVEHVIPLCLGGTNDESNIALACAPCNHQKGQEAWKQKHNNMEYRERKREIIQKYKQYYPGHSE